MAAPVSKPPAQRRRQHLAVPASRFIGRAADLAAIARLFDEGARLVTLWGPAGMGKTRLSQELALAWATGHPDDAVRFCEVEEARDLKAFCGAVARPELTDDPRFAKAADRVRNREILVPIVKDIIKRRARDEWLPLMDAAGIPSGAIRTVGEVCESALLKSRSMR